MNANLTVPSHVEIDIRRPSGEIETVHPGQFREISAKDFAQIKAATAKAGRGECIAYRNITMEVIDTISNDPSYLAELKYIREHNSILRASAGGEKCDQIGGANDTDKTPANKADY